VGEERPAPAMVVSYVSGAEGSVWSFFTMTPIILFQTRGSVVPQILPQLIFIEGLSVLAVLMDGWSKENPDDADFVFLGQTVDEGTKALAILVSFLLVLKTQAANLQFWEGLSELTRMINLLRSVSITICGVVKWDKHPDVAKNAKRVVRLLVLYYFVVLEFFQRTGTNATTTRTQMDRLRDDIAKLAGETEWTILYPGEDKRVKGSVSNHSHTRPTIILFWISLSFRNILDHGALEPPLMAGMLSHLNAVGHCFWDMDKIDKTQFPFPYTQIVKWLTLTFLSMLPFVLAPSCRWVTLFFTAIATIGFFGLDEVAEILESPFGNDPNDIEIRSYGDALMSDLELICRCRDTELDFVFQPHEDVDFSELMSDFDAGFHQKFCSNLAQSKRRASMGVSAATSIHEGDKATLKELQTFQSVLPGAPDTTADTTPQFL